MLLAGLGLFLLAHPIFPQKSIFAASEGAENLETLTFNTGWGISPTSTIEQILSEQTADIIGIQEATTDEVERFDQYLRDHYPYQVFDPSGTGIGLVSKYEIVQEKWLQPPTNGRPILHAKLDLNNQVVDVFVAHIAWPSLSTEPNFGIPNGLNEYWQAREIYFLQEHAEAAGGPVIIMGDFNMSDQSHSYKELSGKFGDAFRDGGWGLGFTFPNYRRVLGREIKTPLLRIDYIFYDERLTIQHAEVFCFEGGSDHCALMASFAIP